jgi:hypothetical protein
MLRGPGWLPYDGRALAIYCRSDSIRHKNSSVRALPVIGRFERVATNCLEIEAGGKIEVIQFR